MITNEWALRIKMENGDSYRVNLVSRDKGEEVLKTIASGDFTTLQNDKGTLLILTKRVLSAEIIQGHWMDL